MLLFSALPTNLGNRSSRFPHSHRHDYHGIIPKTSRLRDTHSEGKVRRSGEPVGARRTNRIKPKSNTHDLRVRIFETVVEVPTEEGEVHLHSQQTKLMK